MSRSFLGKENLSPAMKAALLNIEAGRPSSFGLRGASAHGAHSGTLVALQSRGLIMWDPGHKLTELGVATLKTLRQLKRIQ